MMHVEGPDTRKWRVVTNTVPCKECGNLPIAARSAAGWTMQCPTDCRHGYLFEQWMSKCVRKWNHFQNPM